MDAPIVCRSDQEVADEDLLDTLLKVEHLLNQVSGGVLLFRGLRATKMQALHDEMLARLETGGTLPTGSGVYVFWSFKLAFILAHH